MWFSRLRVRPSNRYAIAPHMSKSDLNGERSQCRYTGLSYCSVTHGEAGIPACRTEMVNMCMHAYVCIYLHVYGCEAWIMTSKLEKQIDGCSIRMLRIVFYISVRSAHFTYEVNIQLIIIKGKGTFLYSAVSSP